jgi:hypothetical protein
VFSYFLSILVAFDLAFQKSGEERNLNTYNREKEFEV